MNTSSAKTLLLLLLLYGAASLIHFIHNAEFLASYPGLPLSWTRAGVYLVWLGITAVGISGWVLYRIGYGWTGLIVMAVYAIMGLDSLAHYIVAPFSAHTFAMNATILLEVGMAGLLFIETIRLMRLRLSTHNSCQQ